MFIIILEFGQNKALAKDNMAEHQTWLNKGFDEGMFVLSGSLKTKGGGGIIAKGVSLETIISYVNEDPFVARNIVTSQIIELSASKLDDRLAFLLS